MKIHDHVKILGGMTEFVGQTGVITDIEDDGLTKLYRVSLDEPINIEGIGEVEDDLWAAEFLEVERNLQSKGSDVKYGNITVQLTGEDGNAFAIVGRVMSALRRNGVPVEEQKQFMHEATSGDYNNLLATCMKWVDVR